MDIISGRFKGRRIYVPHGARIKPTSAIVRRAIFDCLAYCIDGTSVLDLYAGSGALGIEALSRGAKKAVFLENDVRCIRAIKKNISQLKNISTEVFCQDVFKGLGLLKRDIFDIIFLDPPYAEKLVKSTLLEISECDIVSGSSLLVAEHHKKEEIQDNIGVFELIDQKKYGETVISIFKKIDFS